jgi:hypothetical protein
MGFVGMIDRRYDPVKKYNGPRYNSFMRVRINVLWWLYMDLGFRYMDEICPSNAPEGWIPIYNGCYREAQEMNGNVYPENLG